MDDFKKASRLTLVGNAPKPPRKLGDAGLSLWNRVQSEYGITDVGGVELLMQACLAADRAEALAGSSRMASASSPRPASRAIPASSTSWPPGRSSCAPCNGLALPTNRSRPSATHRLTLVGRRHAEPSPIPGC
jgi:hypothetical protein